VPDLFRARFFAGDRVTEYAAKVHDCCQHLHPTQLHRADKCVAAPCLQYQVEAKQSQNHPSFRLQRIQLPTGSSVMAFPPLWFHRKAFHPLGISSQTQVGTPKANQTLALLINARAARFKPLLL